MKNQIGRVYYIPYTTSTGTSIITGVIASIGDDYFEITIYDEKNGLKSECYSIDMIDKIFFDTQGEAQAYIDKYQPKPITIF